MVSFVCYMLHIPFPPPTAGLEKRQPCCPQPLAFGFFFLLSFNMEDMKAVHISIASTGPSDCFYPATQKYDTGLCRQTTVSCKLREGSNVSRTVQPQQILTLTKGCMSPARTRV